MIFGNHYYGTDEDHIYLGGAKGKYIKGYFDTCVEGMKTGMYAYLAHPELILRSTGGVITPEIEEGFHRICKTSQDYNVPLEFNVLGMQHNLRWAMKSIHILDSGNCRSIWCQGYHWYGCT